MFQIEYTPKTIDEEDWKSMKTAAFFYCLAMGGSIAECILNASVNPKKEMKEYCKKEWERAEKEANDLCNKLCAEGCDKTDPDFYKSQDQFLGPVGNQRCNCD